MLSFINQMNPLWEDNKRFSLYFESDILFDLAYLDSGTVSETFIYRKKPPNAFVFNKSHT